MFDSSVIRQTKQGWKLIASFGGLCLGAGSLFVAEHFVKRSNAKVWALMMLASIAVSLGSFCFACFTIRCPACKSRWFWDGVRGQSARSWLFWLMSQRTCPKCGHPK